MTISSYDSMKPMNVVITQKPYMKQHRSNHCHQIGCIICFFLDFCSTITVSVCLLQRSIKTLYEAKTNIVSSVGSVKLVN